MGRVLALTKEIRSMNDLPAALNNDDAWLCASDAQRRLADSMETLIKPLAALVQRGVSVNHAAALFVSKSQAGRSSSGPGESTRLAARRDSL